MKNPRKYGNAPFRTAVLHGGPGAPGEMAPVARELSHITGILEPLQTASTLEGQVLELETILRENGDIPVTLIGWSWGAWLAFIFSARFPAMVDKIILVASGPFSDEYAKDIMDTRLARMTDDERMNAIALMDGLSDPRRNDKDAIMARLGKMIGKADSYDPIPYDEEIMEFSYEIYRNVWEQANELRSSGMLLEMGGRIECPVVAIHGDHDPHPAEGVREPLSALLPDFTFHLLGKCGHCPWLERGARERFFEILRDEVR